MRPGWRCKVEPERVRGLKILGTIAVGTFIFHAPIFRSGGRTGLTFFGWVINHTIFGPPVEYVPAEDYMAELTGIKQEALISEQPEPSTEEIEAVMRYYHLGEASARTLLAHQSIPEDEE